MALLLSCRICNFDDLQEWEPLLLVSWVMTNNVHYCIDTRVLVKSTPLVKLLRNYIRNRGWRKGLPWSGFVLFLLRCCGNFYFNLRYCGFIRLRSFLGFQNVVLILSNCNQNNGVPSSSLAWKIVFFLNSMKKLQKALTWWRYVVNLLYGFNSYIVAIHLLSLVS